MDKISQMFRRFGITDKLLWLYAALIPFIHIAPLKIIGRKVIYADFVFVFLFIAWIIGKFKDKAVLKCGRQLLISLGVLIISILPSFLNSVNIKCSLVELSGLVYLVILFLLVSDITSGDKLRILCAVYFFVSVGIALSGLISFGLAMWSRNPASSQFLYYEGIEKAAHHFPRIQFPFESPNMLLAYLHVAIILGLILFLISRSGKYRRLIFVSCIIILLAAFFTGSRRFTGLLLSIFIIQCFFTKGRMASLLKYATFTGFTLFFIASFITSIWVIFPVKIIKDNNAKTVSLQVSSTYSIHNLMPVVSMNMFKKHPLIGIGLGTYNNNFKDNVDWERLRTSYGFQAYPEYVLPVEYKIINFDPHSLFFGTLAETGLLGLSGLAYFLIVYLIMLCKKIKENKAFSQERIIAACIFAGLAGYLLNSITMDILSMRHFWFMLAIGASLNKVKNVR